jgi:hypothetical protein
MSQQETPNYPLLGEFKFSKRQFKDLEEAFAPFLTLGFQKFNQYQRADALNKMLMKLLKEHQERGFLLFELLDFIQKVHEHNLVERYTLSDIELWMNQFSGMSTEENYFYRALMMGRWIPREDYQPFFPIGMGKIHQGSHFVTAHGSPDIDTMVSSFWGWVDAFSARVSSGLHIWNVPGGAPTSSVEAKLLFRDILHPSVFQYLSKSRGALAITSFDLMTQKGFIRKKRFEHSLGIESDRSHVAVVLVDEDGYYLGDWRPFDVESIRQVIMLLSLCLRWIEGKIHILLFSLFSQKELSREDLSTFGEGIATLSLMECDPLKEMTLRQQQLLDSFLSKVLNVKEGIHAQLSQFVEAVDGLEVGEFNRFWNHLEALKQSELFDSRGRIIENRPLMFFYLEKIVQDLNDTFRSFRLYLDTLEIGFKIKTEVFGYLPQYLSYRTDVKEIENHMGSYPYLTVNVPGPEDKQIPLGIINATDLKRQYLGTVTLRDFCNREETQVPSYLEVISVIDHHKSSLTTNMAPTATIADAQSANSIVCQVAFSIHDEYSLAGMSLESINKQIQDLQKKASTSHHYRILRKLYKRKEIAERKSSFYVDPLREYLEYLQYVFAILDDTDLLTKVSKRDVLSMLELINRLKTLMLKKEVESIHFDDLERNETFVKKAAGKLLKNPDLYSLYSVSSAEKEKVIAENFLKCSKGETSDVFMDTKIQNECCRVGQTKIFAKNYPLFNQNKLKIRDAWYQEARLINQRDPEIDLHLYMISTIACAEELFKGELDKYSHADQMWLWIPEGDIAVEHLKLFLNNFKNCPALVNSNVQIEFYGSRAKEFDSLFKESFLKAQHNFAEDQTEASYVVIYYNAGSLNSRKAMVSPYLPKRLK